MKQPVVLLLETISEKAHQSLSLGASIIEAFTPESALEACHKQEISGIITRGKGRVNQQLIQACPQLRVIARCGVGLDNIDVPYASQRSVKVINLPGSNASTVAEHTVALMLSLQRNLFKSIAEVKSGNWSYRNSYRGDEIRGKTVAILGLGNIGSKVATLVKAFGGKVLYWGRKPQAVPYRYCSLKEALSASDIISLHLPLLDTTTDLLNAQTMALMKPGALLINTSRGAVVHEPSLIDALRRGAIGGYAADVLTAEPPSADHPLLSMDQVLITPHSASLTATTYQQMCEDSVQYLLAVLNGDTIDKKFIFNHHLL